MAFEAFCSKGMNIDRRSIEIPGNKKDMAYRLLGSLLSRAKKLGWKEACRATEGFLLNRRL